MTTDINNFITLDSFKNGRVKISQTISQEGNIYKLLFELGYRKTKLNDKRIYLKREGTFISVVHPSDIRQAFFKFLSHDADYSNILDGIDREEIINWFYQKNAVKENGLYDHYLADTLSESEAHDLRLRTDHDYKHSFDITQLQSMFDEFDFNKTVDSINSYSDNNPTLYYKQVADRKFLVFNHWNAKSKHNDGFDCWIATYPNEKQIGNKKPLELHDILLGFHFGRDFSLIEQYLNPEVVA